MCRFIDWMIFTGYIMINNYETIMKQLYIWMKIMSFNAAKIDKNH